MADKASHDLFRLGWHGSLGVSRQRTVSQGVSLHGSHGITRLRIAWRDFALTAALLEWNTSPRKGNQYEYRETVGSFGLEDLTSIKLVCNNCGHEVACHISKDPKELPRTCPWCSVHWQDSNPKAWEWLNQFVKKTLNHCKEETRYTVRFDMIQKED